MNTFTAHLRVTQQDAGPTLPPAAAETDAEAPRALRLPPPADSQRVPALGQAAVQRDAVAEVDVDLV